MRDEKVAHSQRIFKVLQKVKHNGLNRDVERRGRLVENNQVGVKRNGAGDADAGLLSARHLVREPVQQVKRQADLCCQRLAAPAHFVARDVTKLQQRIGDGTRCGKARVEAVSGVLKDHLDTFALRQRGEAARRNSADVLAVEHDEAIALVDQPHHHHRGCRLAAAGFADQADTLAARDLKADAVDGAEHVGLYRGLRREGFKE